MFVSLNKYHHCSHKLTPSFSAGTILSTQRDLFLTDAAATVLLTTLTLALIADSITCWKRGKRESLFGRRFRLWSLYFVSASSRRQGYQRNSRVMAELAATIRFDLLRLVCILVWIGHGCQRWEGRWMEHNRMSLLLIYSTAEPISLRDAKVRFTMLSVPGWTQDPESWNVRSSIQSRHYPCMLNILVGITWHYTCVSSSSNCC